MNGHHKSNDQLGLTNRWFKVPKEATRPESVILAEQEEGKRMAIYYQQRWNQKTNWPLRRRDQNGTSKKNPTDS